MTTRPGQHRRRTALFAAGAAVALTLTACTGNSSDGESVTTATTEPTTMTESAAEPLVDAEVGEEISEGSATWTIHSISRDTQCDYGPSDEQHDGYDLIQFRASVHNEHPDEGFSFDPTDAVDADGEPAEWPDDMRDNTAPCEPVPGDDGYVNWDDGVDPATEAFVYGAFAAPENVEFMSIRGYKFGVPEDYIDDVQGPDEEVAADPATDPVAEPAPEETPAEPNSIWAPTGQGHQCPRTDAFVWDPADCTPENLGAGPLPDPASIPVADGGTCPAAVCGYGHDEYGNPNPSSGELQTQFGCEDGYITDAELCAAVGRPLN